MKQIWKSRLDRKYWVIRQVSRVLIVTILVQLFVPLESKALTTGPSQPEVMQFQQAGTSGMVDPFTGAFNYNIPLFELPGPNGSYPFNLAYQSGITMDQEASWVGLGWSLNPGAITRTMRGLPDEFDGDAVHIDQDQRPDWTLGISGQGGAEILGADSDVGLGLGVNPTYYYNSYRGFGITFGGGIDLGFGNSRLVGSSLNLSLDTQDGIDVSPKMGLSFKGEKNGQKFSMGMGYNSRRGLTDVTLSCTSTNTTIKDARSVGATSTCYSASNGFVPSIERGMAGAAVSFGIRTGVTPVVDPYWGITGSYNISTLAWKHKDIPAYGYMNMQEAPEDAMTDVNRYHDGVLRKESPNLAVPTLTNDVYSISGQGVGGTFRAWRNDVGVATNRKTESVSGNLHFGTEINVQKAAFDIYGGANVASSRMWKGENQTLIENNNSHGYGFHGSNNYREDYEPWYFKVGGDNSTDPTDDLAYVGGEGAVRIAAWIDPDGNGRNLGHLYNGLEDRNGVVISGLQAKESYDTDPNRRMRNEVVDYVRVSDLQSNAGGFGEYQIKHYQAPSNAISFTPQNAPSASLVRNHEGHHFGGMSVSKTDGTRYVYGLPAYNKKQAESLFSIGDADMGQCSSLVNMDLLIVSGDTTPDYKVFGTDNYYSRTEIPEYAHSYLLTSVLGQDYVDADDTPGPSDGDLGYWVKFNYVKVNDYCWRAPFSGANYERGQRSVIDDNKASYMYGEREQWYLASAETKTHIAKFEIQRREDNRGAKSEYLNRHPQLPQYGTYSYRLSSASLYSKLELANNSNVAPITKVTLEHGYELCPNTVNNGVANPNITNSGKLTLHKVTFEHQGNTRGALNPYEFTYSASNPGYDPLAQDQWGTYRSALDPCQSLVYPYSNQSTSRTILDAESSSWHLTEIQLPTGGKIKVNYEANDYAYVQNKPAMEMYKIMGRLDNGTFTDEIYTEDYHKPNASSTLREQERTIYIDLGRNIYRTTEADSILRGNSSVYFKTLMSMKKQSHQLKEYVQAFLQIDEADHGLYYLPGQTPGQGTQYIYITLKECDWNDGKLTDYHPLAVAGWMHFRSHLPQLLSLPAINFPAADPGTSAFARRQMAMSLFDNLSDIKDLFTNYYGRADGELWSNELDPDYSWVRLNSLDMRKVGGGCRVKKITIEDDFDPRSTNPNPPDETGVVYDYTMVENGRTISSGVAAYEPLVGRDENPFFQHKRYPMSIPMMSDYELFQANPLNEAYMPAPVVGYRQVTVKSLNTEKVLGDPLLAGIPTTGVTVHEFWTAKDFPTLTDETKIRMKPFHPVIPIPFIGTFSYNDLTASQGYSITLNDMHGRPKKVTEYGIDNQGKFIPSPISWVEYEYGSTVHNAGTDKEYRSIENEVDALLYDVDPNDGTKSDVAPRILGQDHEFFADMREYDAHAASGGVAANIDMPAWLPFPTFWPMASYSYSRSRTAVTNKIIHKTGILKGTRAFNQGSLVKTENLLYDAQTGRPLLTRVTNDYDAPIYSYEYPAFWAYDKMGPAYKNCGLAYMSPSVTSNVTMGTGYYSATGLSGNGMYPDLLVPGDEVIVKPSGGNPSKAWFVKFDGPLAIFYSESNIAGSSVLFRNHRSGRRNLLGVTAEKIVSLRNPTINRGSQMCWRDVTNPTAVVESTWVTTTVVQVPVLLPCMQNLAWQLNGFFADPASSPGGGWYQPLSGPQFGCGNCTTTHFSVVGTYQVQLECAGPGADCSFSIVDNGLNAIPVQDIDRIDNVQLVTTNPVVNLGTGSPFGLKMDVYTNGSQVPFVGWFSGCEGLFNDGVDYIDQEVNEYHSTLTATPSNEILQTPMFMLDSVLSATATTFSDAWMQDFSDVRFTGTTAAQQLQRLEGLHPFANGQRGVWRPKDSYVYVTDRRQTPNEVNTAKDGTFSGMPMFAFQSITFDHCAPNWRKTNEVTRYSPYGVELENRDVLNVYSAALYGYNGKLPIAVSANADYREVGFESFEEYDLTPQVGLLDLSTGNLDFPEAGGGTPRQVWTYTDITYGSGANFSIDGSMTNSILLNPVAPNGMVQGRTHGEDFNHSVAYGEKQQVPNYGSSTLVTTSNAPYLHNFTYPQQYYAGRVVYQRPSLATNNLVLPTLGAHSDAKAHTGKKSLKVNGIGTYPQNRLKLSAGESYTLQLWVSRENTDVHTFQNTGNVSQSSQVGVSVKFYDAGGTLISTTAAFRPTGELVEGWQKIEGNFDVPSGTENVALVLNSGKIGTDPNYADTYFDDIRLQPLKSKMTCYVYDPANYKLRATLDDDNFALIYHYDESGNLYLVQKETIEGIRTVQESRGFLYQN